MQWGNPSTASATFTVDTTGPAIAISKPASGSSVATATPELDYTTGDAVAASVVVKVDGTVVTTANGDKLDSLADGAHTVTVTGSDQWGNPSTASSTFTVDTVRARRGVYGEAGQLDQRHQRRLHLGWQRQPLSGLRPGLRNQA